MNMTESVLIFSYCAGKMDKRGSTLIIFIQMVFLDDKVCTAKLYDKITNQPRVNQRKRQTGHPRSKNEDD